MFDYLLTVKLHTGLLSNSVDKNISVFKSESKNLLFKNNRVQPAVAMLRLPGRKRKGKGEKKAETLTRSDSPKTTPAKGGVTSSSVPSVRVEDATQPYKSPSVSGQGQSCELETSLSLSKPIKHVPIPHSNLSDRGYASQPSMNTLGEGGSVLKMYSSMSSVSNASADSYHTALSNPSPDSIGHVSVRFALSARQDDMMKEVLEKLNQIESSQKNLTTRVGNLEVMMKQLQPCTTEREGTNTSIMGSTIHIPDSIEVCRYKQYCL